LSKLIVRGKVPRSVTELEPSETCQHARINEIGVDFDKDEMLLRLVRCQRCGLLIRQYLSMI